MMNNTYFVEAHHVEKSLFTPEFWILIYKAKVCGAAGSSCQAPEALANQPTRARRRPACGRPARSWRRPAEWQVPAPPADISPFCPPPAPPVPLQIIQLATDNSDSWQGLINIIASDHFQAVFGFDPPIKDFIFESEMCPPDTGC